MLVSAAHAVEVFNYSCTTKSNHGSGIATADILLQEGHRIGFTATDDSISMVPIMVADGLWLVPVP